MIDRASRARIERLLRGEIRAIDLTNLFLYARDRCDGRESVQEIGDFVAHHSEREKGIITRRTQDWFTTARFIAPYMTNAIDTKKLPENFPEVLQASFRGSTKVLFKNCSFGRVRAGRLLPRAIEKLGKNLDGTLTITKEHTSDELSLMRTLSCHLTVRPAFDENRLFEDFTKTLRDQGLLQKNEADKFERLKHWVGLFAVSVMHNCLIRMTDGSTIKLTANKNKNGKNIGVSAAIPALPLPNGNLILLSQHIFSTDCDGATFCTEELLNQPWEFELELTTDGLLGKLG